MTVDTPTNVHAPERTTSQPSPSARHRQPHDPPSLSETANDAIECFQNYAKERPDVVAMCCLGVGFVLGWKLKPW